MESSHRRSGFLADFFELFHNFRIRPAERKAMIQAFQSQCDGYLVKPFDRVSVAATLAEIGISLPVPALG